VDEPLEFTWDEAKAAANAAKHGVTFEVAVNVFHAEDRQDVPTRHATDSESRSVAYGTVEGLLLAVVYTMRGEVIRIISARRANRTERKRHGQI
jgi:uncharacterized DUF497 family protein